MKLDFDVKLLYDNIEVQLANKEYCCIDCHSVPSSTINLNQILHILHIQDSFRPAIHNVLVYLYTPLYWNIVIGSLQLK